MRQLTNMEKTRSHIARKIYKLCLSGVLANKEVVITPLSVRAPIIIKLMCDSGIHPIAITDNSTNKTGVFCTGVKVHATEDYLRKLKKDRIVIIYGAKKTVSVISKQLISWGYKDKRDFIKINYTKTKLSSVLSNKFYTISKKDGILTFILSCFHMAIAYMRFNILQRKYNIDLSDVIFFEQIRPIGDAYLSCAFLKEYIKINSINKYVYCVNGKNAAMVATLFKLKRVILLNDNECKDLLKLYIYFGEGITGIRSSFIRGNRLRNVIPTKLNERKMMITFADRFKYDTYELDTNARRHLPTFDYGREVNSFFTKFGLPDKRTIIIAPYFGGYDSTIPFAFWIELASMLTKAGFTVCTNVSNEYEAVIPDTKRVEFSLSASVPIIEQAGYFIGIRSGFCDLVSSAKCEMIVIYDEQTDKNRYNFFGLKLMGIRDDIHEYVYNFNNHRLIIDSIIHNFTNIDDRIVT